MEPHQKSSWLNGGCLRGEFDLYLLSPVTPWKLGGRCCCVKLPLKWLSVLVSSPQQSQTILDLFICAWGKFGSTAVSTPSLPLVFKPLRQQVWDQNCSATLNYICWQSNSLAAGWWRPTPLLWTDVRGNLLARTCISFHNLAVCQLKNVWLLGIPSTIKALSWFVIWLCAAFSNTGPHSKITEWRESMQVEGGENVKHLLPLIQTS